MLEKVAAIFLAMIPDLPTPDMKILFEFNINSTAFAKLSSMFEYKVLNAFIDSFIVLRISDNIMSLSNLFS